MHYTTKNYSPGVAKTGDTYQAYPNAEHWTYVNTPTGYKWVKTASLSALPLPPGPPGQHVPTPIFGGYWTMNGRAIEDAIASDNKARTATETSDKLPPMTCSEGCGFTNEYVGKEHLINGLYVCRQCRPRYERRQRTLALKAAHEEATSDPFAYGPSWKDGVGGL